MQPQADPFIAPECRAEIEILYQDEAILLINKPSGLLSLSGKHVLNFDSVHYRLVQQFADCRLLHRLDFGTSGIMLVALNKAINGVLTKQFQQQQIHKTYTAMLQGHINPPQGVIEVPIAKGEFPLQKICQQTGKAANSEYRLLEHCLVNAAPASRVLFTPTTGRTHQLRVHSMAMGHPILGDDLYANEPAFLQANRLMLHATSLDFTHPLSGERIRFACDCPF